MPEAEDVKLFEFGVVLHPQLDAVLFGVADEEPMRRCAVSYWSRLITEAKGLLVRCRCSKKLIKGYSQRGGNRSEACRVGLALQVPSDNSNANRYGVLAVHSVTANRFGGQYKEEERQGSQKAYDLPLVHLRVLDTDRASSLHQCARNDATLFGGAEQGCRLSAQLPSVSFAGKFAV